MVCVPVPEHTAAGAVGCTVIAGRAFTVTENATAVPETPDPEFVTAIVPLYVPAGAAAGITNGIGVPGNDVKETFKNPAPVAVAS